MSSKRNESNRSEDAAALVTTEAVRHAVEQLLRALREPESRDAALEEFQESVWLDPEQFGSEPVQAVLGDVAYDLASAEPGEARADQLIRNALDALRTLGVDIPGV